MRKDLCLGCGICAQSCPRRAISLPWGWAEIDQNRCNSCRLCLDLCPQGAIAEVVPVSREELKATVFSLKRQVDDLLAKIDRLKR